MATINTLKTFIKKKQLLTAADKVLLAVSGGKDSMLMACLFHDLGYQGIIAHCNFQLRGEESDKDEDLVRQYAERLGYPFFVQYFDTEAYAKEHKISIQMAARELRYAWFAELAKAEGCVVTAIAQHQNDHIETALLNLTRGTGLQGLLGISPKRGDLIRPLLCFTAEEVEKTAKEYAVPYRDDQSNFSTKYARNKIRLEVIPKLKEIQPDFEQVMQQNMQYFEESYRFIERIVADIRKAIMQEEEGQVKIKLADLAAYQDDSYLLFELFKPYGFKKEQLMDLKDCLKRPMGQLFRSASTEALLDRELLILRPIPEEAALQLEIPSFDAPISVQGKQLTARKGKKTEIASSPDSVSIDADLLVYPLQLRYWQQGDSFVPFGMKGRKKLSDFFIQQKIDRFAKGQVPILVNGDGQIIWLLNHRLDNRFRVTENTKKVLTLVLK